MNCFSSTEIASRVCSVSGHLVVSIHATPALGPKTAGVTLLIPTFQVLCSRCGLPIDKIQGRVNVSRKKKRGQDHDANS